MEYDRTWKTKGFCCVISWDISSVAKFDEAHGATLICSLGKLGDDMSIIWTSERFANYGRKVWNIDEENDEKTAVAAIEKTEEVLPVFAYADLSGRYENGCTAG